jgi:hypothetical protein
MLPPCLCYPRPPPWWMGGDLGPSPRARQALSAAAALGPRRPRRPRERGATGVRARPPPERQWRCPKVRSKRTETACRAQKPNRDATETAKRLGAAYICCCVLAQTCMGAGRRCTSARCASALNLRPYWYSKTTSVPHTASAAAPTPPATSGAHAMSPLPPSPLPSNTCSNRQPDAPQCEGTLAGAPQAGHIQHLVGRLLARVH